MNVYRKRVVDMNKVREIEERTMSVFFKNQNLYDMLVKKRELKKQKIMRGEIFLDENKLENFTIPNDIMREGKYKFNLFLNGQFHNYKDYRKINFDQFTGIIVSHKEWEILSSIPENKKIIEQLEYENWKILSDIEEDFKHLEEEIEEDFKHIEEEIEKYKEAEDFSTPQSKKTGPKKVYIFKKPKVEKKVKKPSPRKTAYEMMRAKVEEIKEQWRRKKDTIDLNEIDPFPVPKKEGCIDREKVESIKGQWEKKKKYMSGIEKIDTPSAPKEGCVDRDKVESLKEKWKRKGATIK